MKQIKISLAAIAFAVAMGGTFMAKSATTASPNDCSTQSFQTVGNFNSDNCDKTPNVLCCYELGSDTQIKKSH